MKGENRVLNVGDLIFQRRDSVALRLIHAIFGIAIVLFFRRIELVNAEKLPKKSGILFVSNHPNALIDPALVFIAIPRKISFLAKSTLFKMPVIKYLLHAVEALPLYRQMDAGADVSKNQKTFSLCQQLLQKGGAIAMFPEGISHNESKIQPLKTGAARIALGTVSVKSETSDFRLKIVPVGLYYTNKTTFRSEALLHFGEPLEVFPVDLDENGQPEKEAVRKLTNEIEQSLRDVTINAETEAELQTATIAERVLTSVGENENLAERFDSLKNYVSQKRIENFTEINSDESLDEKLADFDKRLEKIGLETEHLELSNYSKRFVIKQAILQSWFLVLWMPLAIFGAVIHFPAYQICKLLAYLQKRKGDDDVVSTFKVLGGLVLMPLSWIISAIILYFYTNLTFALLSVPFSFLCGYIALRTLEEIEELRGWSKAILLFFSKREQFLRLVVEKKNLHKELKFEK